jgi:HK97 family phage major capsid protein
VVDAIGRPLLPQGSPAITLVGRPIVIATQMPNVAPGSTPTLVGDLRRTFTIVTRKDPTITSTHIRAAGAYYTRRKRGLAPV